MVKRKLFFFCIAFFACSVVLQAGEILDLSAISSDGMIIENDFSGFPDEQGLLKTYKLKLPDFEKGLIIIQSRTPDETRDKKFGLEARSGNRIAERVFSPGENFENATDALGQLMLLKLTNGKYRAILPLVGKDSMSWIRTDNQGKWIVVHGSLGTARVESDLPIAAWIDDENPYRAVYNVWQKALELIPSEIRSRFREEKKYPEQFKYLGWCSWEAYHRDVSEKLILEIIKDYSSSGLPVKYILIDGGHWSFEKGVGPNPKTFPNGYGNIIAAMDGKPFQWLGLHYQSLGYSLGVRPAPNNDLGKYNQYVKAIKGNGKYSIAPKDTPEAMNKYWEYLTSFGLKDGISFVKIDFLKDPLVLNGALWNSIEKQENAVRSATMFKIAMEESLHKYDLGLMNCNGNNWPMPFYAKYSNSTRCSEDYHKNQFDSAIMHTYNSYTTILYLGHLYWGDHDMFHSSDKLAGQLMAVSKAMSGGPIYISDKPEDAVPENITPLCYSDGSLPRPLAPAIMSEDSLFYDLYSFNDSLFKVFAPLANNSVAIHISNLNRTPKQVETFISLKDYNNASAMMQPYPGPWKIPTEGLVLFDILEGKGRKFSDTESISLTEPLAHKLFQLSPVRKGWSFIGRTDKYLCAATGKIVSASNSELKVSLTEPGPFAIYSSTGTPKAKGIKFTDIGNGFFKADANNQKIITINR
jgi:hypothetical protein